MVRRQSAGADAALQRRARQIARALARAYPDALCALNHKTPFQLLSATILSAQCTDERVNLVTPELFRQFPTPEKLAQASQPAVEVLIKSAGFFRAKARNLRAMAQKLVSDSDGNFRPASIPGNVYCS